MCADEAYDRIGYWSEIKLDILRKYASAYSKIMQKNSLHHVYVDAFAGGGRHFSLTSGELVPGSPQIALGIDPPFKEYHFIDLKETKIKSLREIAQDRADVHLYQGDCNSILLESIFPRIRYDQFKRGLMLLDPYGLHLNWEVIAMSAGMKSIEIFLNFPVADMNRNVLWTNPDRVDPRQRERLNAFWGDESWRGVAYTSQPGLFGEIAEKTTNQEVVEGFRQRLLNVAGFAFVPQPLAMLNSQNAVVYYLFFASHNQTGEKIVADIFKKYRKGGQA
ncbi:MAG: three-Cys-motif partner protein TcmP [Desulfomonile tiedjei]|nr:three-Cys-motif partner protein TcmP [Desulfomonile tiedjei]